MLFDNVMFSSVLLTHKANLDYPYAEGPPKVARIIKKKGCFWRWLETEYRIKQDWDEQSSWLFLRETIFACGWKAGSFSLGNIEKTKPI